MGHRKGGIEKIRVSFLLYYEIFSEKIGDWIYIQQVKFHCQFIYSSQNIELHLEVIPCQYGLL